MNGNTRIDGGVEGLFVPTLASQMASWGATILAAIEEPLHGASHSVWSVSFLLQGKVLGRRRGLVYGWKLFCFRHRTWDHAVVWALLYVPVVRNLWLRQICFLGPPKEYFSLSRSVETSLWIRCASITDVLSTSLVASSLRTLCTQTSIHQL